jgi:ubiquinone/menaquinone biosynthesis C-methylase UbiE
MNEDDFRVFADHYDQLYLERKNYEMEAKTVKAIIREPESKKARTLLDVGCGTAEHLKYLSADFHCTGVDINHKMIEAARSKVPEATFQVANMINLRLKNKFDVIICLFSSIGYVQTFSNLVKTLGNFHTHLNNEGLVIVEPWVFRKDFKQGHISLDTYEHDQTKFVRMARSKISGSKWLVFMHYLVGKNGEIKYVREVHRMLALDYPDYIRAFQSAGFDDVKYLTEGLWDGCRGLFVAR